MPDHAEYKSLKRSWIDALAVFLVTLILLFLAMTRRPSFYDEGLVLTGAVRLMAGQIPHRDFYASYGPATFFVPALLFRIFGKSILIYALYEVLLRSAVVAVVYGIASRYCRTVTSIAAALVALLWIFGINLSGSSLPVLLLDLAGTALLLPVLRGSFSTWRLILAGATAGMATLFRYDTGIALCAIHAAILIVAAYFAHPVNVGRLHAFAANLWKYLAGYIALTLPPVLYYLSVASPRPFIHDLILYPSTAYRRGRNLPFPGPSLQGFDQNEVYLPIAIGLLCIYVLSRRERNRRWLSFLLAFGLLMGVMYLKGVVRISTAQVILSIVPSLLLLAVLFDHRNEFPRALRAIVYVLATLSFLTAGWCGLRQARDISVQHLTMLEWIMPHSPRKFSGLETAWCNTENPATKGLCFVPEPDRIRSIEFIDAHTTAQQALYVGVTHHDKIFANDNIVYFLSQRQPATHWSMFDPGLQNSAPIQLQMIEDIKTAAPPYVVLDSEFENVNEPNDSSRSSGVYLLDNYLHAAYRPAETFGSMSVWQRK